MCLYFWIPIIESSKVCAVKFITFGELQAPVTLSSGLAEYSQIAPKRNNMSVTSARWDWIFWENKASPGQTTVSPSFWNFNTHLRGQNGPGRCSHNYNEGRNQSPHAPNPPPHHSLLLCICPPLNQRWFFSPPSEVGLTCDCLWPKEYGRSDILGIPLSPGHKRICSLHSLLLQTLLRTQPPCSKNSKWHGKSTWRRTVAIRVAALTELPAESQYQAPQPRTQLSPCQEHMEQRAAQLSQSPQNCDRCQKGHCFKPRHAEGAAKQWN